MTEEKLHHYAEKLSNAKDPHWNMSDRPNITQGHKIYESFISKNRKHIRDNPKEKRKGSAKSKALNKLKVIQY